MSKAMPQTLKQKVAKTMAGSNPSLIPQPRPRPEPPSDEGPVHTIDELIGNRSDKAQLRVLVAKHLELNRQKKELEKQVDFLTSQIKPFIASYGIDKMICDGARINHFPTTRKTVNAMKLLAAGVDQPTIDLCTDVSTSYTLKIGDA